jgi:demethylmenaquinone methyltransferase/2-methoxy-6-polyprenyl-1,4-benzoquinol methylase
MGNELVYERHRVARKFFTGVSSSYDTVVSVTTFGRDAAWKSAMLELVPSGNCRVLDLACGTGILTFAIAGRASEVVGIDLMEENVRVAKEKSRQYTSNVAFFASAAERIPQCDKSFDCITASYLPKYCDIDLVVKECARLLKSKGRLVMHDFTYPRNAFMRGLWGTYFKILRITGLFTPSWRPVFNGLDGVIRESKWVDELVHAMMNNGFKNVQRRSMTCGTAMLVWGDRE